MTTQADNGVKPNSKPFVRNRVQLAKPQQTAYSGRTSANSPMMARVRQAKQSPAPQSYAGQAAPMTDARTGQYPQESGLGSAMDRLAYLGTNNIPWSDIDNSASPGWAKELYNRGLTTYNGRPDAPIVNAPAPAPAFTPEEQNYMNRLQAQQMVDNIFAKYPGLTGGATR